MFNPLACLSFGVQRHDEEEAAAVNYPSPPSTTPSTPRSWSSSSAKYGTNIFCISGRNKKNPFSTLGLDKFSTLLMDLEERRRKIYEQLPSHSHRIPYIRFIYSNTGDWVPIVVQLRDLNNDHKHRHNKQKHKKAALAKAMGSKAVGSHGGHQHKPQLVTDKAQPPADTNKYLPSSRSTCPTTTTTTAAATAIPTTHAVNSSKASSTLKPMFQFRQSPAACSSSADVRKAATNKKNIQTISRRHSSQQITQSHSKHRSLEGWRLPSQYLPIVVVLSLVCLVVFGRSVAILLTAAWWYLIPTTKTPPTPIIQKPKKSSIVNKEYARKSSDNNISHP